MDDLSLQGIAHFNAARFSEAADCFRASIARGERGPEARCFLAHVFDALNRPPEAAAEFSAVLGRFPRHQPAYAGLANLLLRRGELPGGAAALRGVLALKAPVESERRARIEILRACASALHAAAELKPAEAALRRIIKWEPRDKKARRQLIEILHAREQACLTAGRNGPAQRALRAALALEPGNKESRRRLVEMLRRRALAHITAGHRADAERALRAALALGANDGESRRSLSEIRRIHARMKRSLLIQKADIRRVKRRRRAEAAMKAAFRQAEAAMTAAFKLYFTQPRTLGAAALEVTRARELMARGLTAAAHGSLRRALALAPRDATARGARKTLVRLCSLSRVAARCAEQEERGLRRALRRSPENDEIRKGIAGIMRTRALAHAVPNTPSRFQHARRAWESILKLYPKDAYAHISISLLMRWTGRPEQERASLRRALAKGLELSQAERFKALMRLGRYPEAVRLAEQILDKGLSLIDFRAFSDPWEKDNRPDREAPQTDLAALERGFKAAPGPWLQFYLGSLGGPRGLKHFDALPRGDRYRWMHYNAAMEALFSGSFRPAIRWFNIALQDKTLDWRAHGYLAEAYACIGAPSKARREMARGLDRVPEDERAQVYAWWGELELQLGDYAKALALTSKACVMGAPFAHGWKGASMLKLGRREEALAQLNAALELYPHDAEAMLWRAEAKRELGRPREALKDLQSVGPQHAVWVLFNSALAKHALGDDAGMRSDFDHLPPEVAGHVRRRLGLRGRATLDSGTIVRVLEAGLKLGRGFRRAEYGQAIWLSRRRG